MAKFLDINGVQHLWSKINMQDYPNNDMLMSVIQAIDETKLDKNVLSGNNELNWDGVALDNIQVDWFMHLVSYDIPAGFEYVINGKYAWNNEDFLENDLFVFSGENYIGLSHIENPSLSTDITALAILKDNTLVFNTNYSISGFYMKGDPEYGEFISSLYYEWNLLDWKANKKDLVQADWNENNQLSLAHIQNRPFYTEENIVDITGLSFSSSSLFFDYSPSEHNLNIPFALGQIWNMHYINHQGGQNFESSYEGLEVKEAEDGTLYIGSYPDVNDIPFYITNSTTHGNSGWLRMINPTDISITCVSGTVVGEPIIHHIPAKYINPQNIKDMYWDGNVDIAGITFEDIKLATGWDVNKHYLNIPFALGQTWSVRYTNKYGNESSYDDLEVQQADDGTLYIGQYPEAMDIPFYITSDVMCGNASWGGMMNPKNINLIGVSGSFNAINQIQPKYIKDMYYDNRHEAATDSVYIDCTVGPLGFVKVADNIDFDLIKVKTMSLVVGGSYFKEVAVNALHDNMGVHVEYDGDWWFNYFATQEEADYFWDDLWGSDDPNPFETGLYIWANSDEGENVNITYSFTYEDGEVHCMPSKYIKDMYYDNGITVTEYIPETTLDFSSTSKVDWGQSKAGYIYEYIQLPLIVDQQYKVIFDEAEYTLTAFRDIEFGNIVIGNGAFVYDSNEDNDLPFAIGIYNSGEIEAYVIVSDQNSHTFSIVEIKHDIKQLDIKYLPIMEEAINELYEIDNITNENHEFFDDPSYQMLLGKHRITVDGNIEILEFVDDGGYSFAESDNIYIETWYGGIYFWFPDFDSDNPQIHSVKIEGFKAAIKKEHLPQSDWNQNDPDGDGYIKNRPFYEKIKNVYYEGTFILDEYGNTQINVSKVPFKSNDYIYIELDGVEYYCQCLDDQDANYGYFIPIRPSNWYRGLPQIIETGWVYFDRFTEPDNHFIDGKPHKLKIYDKELKTIDFKYLPNSLYHIDKLHTLYEGNIILDENNYYSWPNTLPFAEKNKYLTIINGDEFIQTAYWTETEMSLYPNLIKNGFDTGYIDNYTIRLNPPAFSPGDNVNVAIYEIEYKGIDSIYLPNCLSSENPIGSGTVNINGDLSTKHGDRSFILGSGSFATGYDSFVGGSHLISHNNYDHVIGQHNTNNYHIIENTAANSNVWYSSTSEYGYEITNIVPDLDLGVFYFDIVGETTYGNVSLQHFYISQGAIKYIYGRPTIRNYKIPIAKNSSGWGGMNYSEKIVSITNDDLSFVIGNGDYNKRSNAHTVYKDGTGWFAGDVYVGSTSGTNKDDGSKKLITLDDIPEVESQVFIVTYDSVNDYDDLGEAIYNASREGKIVVFQSGDWFYNLTYSEIEPSHAATFTCADWNGHIRSIHVHYSEITSEDFDTVNYVDTAINDLSQGLTLTDTVTGVNYLITVTNGKLTMQEV